MTTDATIPDPVVARVRTAGAHASSVAFFALILALGAVLAILAWRGHAAGFVGALPVGQDRAGERVAVLGTDARDLTAVDLPAGRSRALVGRWVLVRGHHPLGARASAVPEIAVAPLPALPWIAGLDIHGLGRWRLAPSLAGIAIGASVLLLGFLALRVVAAAVAGVLGGLLAWHALVLAAWEGLVQPPSGAAGLVFAAGAVVGFVAALRGGLLGYFLQRLVLLLLLWTLAPALGAQLALAPRLVRALAVLVALVSPGVGLVAVGAGFLAAGLDAHGLGAALVFLAAVVAVHVLSDGRAWMPSPRSSAVQAAPLRSGHGAVPLGTLLGGRP